jgi:UDP-N-acetyl-D-mannosaminuronic acid dehydrogenase
MKIGVIGLGYVGLTFATLAAYKGVEVFAIEKSDEIKKSLKNRKAHFFEPGLDDMLQHLMEKKIFLKNKFEINDNIEVFFITVGTPLLFDSKSPNYQYLLSAIDSIKDVYDGTQLVILRSTVSVGTSRNFVIPHLSKLSGLSEDKILLSFCPERTIEGKAVSELQELPQIIAGNNTKSFKIAEELFRKITPSIIEAESLEAAELVKLFNNTYRDIHFAIGNVFNEIAQEYGINGTEVIKIANTGYIRSNISQPGFVGGPCLEKDSYILTVNMPKSPGYDFVINSRKYNESLEDKVVSWISSNFTTSTKICISGLAFKGIPETSDLRGSNSLNIVVKLNKLGFEPNLHDFVANPLEVNSLLKGKFSENIYDAVNDCAGLIILNNNNRYNFLELNKILKNMNQEKVTILDYWSSLNQFTIKLYENIIYKTAGNIKL